MKNLLAEIKKAIQKKWIKCLIIIIISIGLITMGYIIKGVFFTTKCQECKTCEVCENNNNPDNNSECKNKDINSCPTEQLNKKEIFIASREDNELIITAFTDKEGKLYLKDNLSNKIVSSTGIQGKIIDIAITTNCSEGEFTKFVVLTDNNEIYINKYETISTDLSDDYRKVLGYNYKLDFIKITTDSKIKNIKATPFKTPQSCDGTEIVITKDNNKKYLLDYLEDQDREIITSASISSKTYEETYPFSKSYGGIELSIYVLFNNTITYKDYVTTIVDQANNNLKNVKDIFFVKKDNIDRTYIMTETNRLLYINNLDYSEDKYSKVIAKEYNNKTIKSYELKNSNRDLIIMYTDSTSETIELY